MSAAYDLPLRSSRKRHPANPGDALPSSSLTLVENIPMCDEAGAERLGAHPHLKSSDVGVRRDDPGNAKLSSPEQWSNLGTALWNVGRYGEARTALHEARRLAPQDADIALSLARLEMDCGRYQRANDMFQIALGKFPQLAEVRIPAARACHELGKKRRAMALVAGWPGWTLDDDTAADLAALMIRIGKVRAGLILMKRISDLSRVGTRALAGLTFSLAQADRPKKARYCLALLPHPENIRDTALREEVLTAYARVAQQAGDLPSARRFLEFLETPPAPGVCRCARPYFMLAEICFQMLDMEMAKKALVTGQCIHMRSADIASPLAIEISHYT